MNTNDKTLTCSRVLYGLVCFITFLEQNYSSLTCPPSRPPFLFLLPFFSPHTSSLSSLFPFSSFLPPLSFLIFFPLPYPPFPILSYFVKFETYKSREISIINSWFLSYHSNSTITNSCPVLLYQYFSLSLLALSSELF